MFSRQVLCSCCWRLNNRSPGLRSRRPVPRPSEPRRPSAGFHSGVANHVAYFERGRDQGQHDQKMGTRGGRASLLWVAQRRYECDPSPIRDRLYCTACRPAPRNLPHLVKPNGEDAGDNGFVDGISTSKTGKAIGVRAAHTWSFERQGEPVAVVTRESFDGWLPRVLPGRVREMLNRTLQSQLETE